MTTLVGHHDRARAQAHWQSSRSHADDGSALGEEKVANSLGNNDFALLAWKLWEDFQAQAPAPKREKPLSIDSTAPLMNTQFDESSFSAPDLQMYNVALSVAARLPSHPHKLDDCLEGLHRAARMSDLAGECSFTPDRFTFNTLLDGYGRRGDLDRAAAIVLEEMDAAGVAPDIVSFNTLAKAYARNGRSVCFAR